MRELLGLLKRFIPPYRGKLLASVLFNILAALLNLLAFSLVIPILKILFQIERPVRDYIPLDSIDKWSITGLKETADAIAHNFSYGISTLIEQFGASQTLIFLAIFLVVMTLIKVLSAYMGLFFLIPIRTGVVRDLRNQINKKILSLPLGFFSNERKGDIMARISGDVTEVENSVMSSLDMLLKNPIMIVIYLTTMILISWQLTLFVFLLLPIAGFVMGRVGKALKRTSLLAQTQWGELLSLIEETLSGLRIIKAFTSESYIDQKFQYANNGYRSTTMRVARRQQLAHPMSEFLGTATIAIVLWYGGSLILDGQSGSLDASTFIYYLVVFYSLINPIKDFSKSLYTVKKGMASMARIDQILQAENDIKDPDQPKPIAFNECIRYENVSFKYAEEWVLQDVNLEIKKGQRIALVGHSGSGKSTLADLLPRFYDVVRGRITIDGIDIRDVALADLRHLIGNVSQEAILFNDTVAGNIAFGDPNPNMKLVEQAARVANAEEFILNLPEGYHTNIGDRGNKLSGGQKQRLSIARAIYKNPPILILDEATSALDTESERLVQGALDELMQGRTSIVIAHRLSTIVAADMICVVHNGQIVEYGTHQELLAKGEHYYNLYTLQVYGGGMK